MTFGPLWRSHLERRIKPVMAGRPRRIPSALPETPDCLMRSPTGPMSVNEITSTSRADGSEAERSLANVISAPPTEMPAITWTTFTRPLGIDGSGIKAPNPNNPQVSTSFGCGRARLGTNGRSEAGGRRDAAGIEVTRQNFVRMRQFSQSGAGVSPGGAVFGENVTRPFGERLLERIFGNDAIGQSARVHHLDDPAFARGTEHRATVGDGFHQNVGLALVAGREDEQAGFLVPGNQVLDESYQVDGLAKAEVLDEAGQPGAFGSLAQNGQPRVWMGAKIDGEGAYQAVKALLGCQSSDAQKKSAIARCWLSVGDGRQCQ